MEFLEHRRLRERPYQPNGEVRCLLRRRASRKQVMLSDSIERHTNPRVQVHPRLPENAAHYLSRRFSTAGHAAGYLYPPEDFEVTFQAAGGIPRKLNRLAKLALEFAREQEYSKATPAALDGVVRGMNRQQTLAIA